MRGDAPIVIAMCSALSACGAHRAAPQAPGPAPAHPSSAQQLTPDLVLAKVRGGYTTGVQRCYTRYLKNRSGHGRVLVSFTVDERGHAQDGAASGVPHRLGDCIVAEVARWRFPAPAAGEQRFAVPLDLVVD